MVVLQCVCLSTSDSELTCTFGIKIQLTHNYDVYCSTESLSMEHAEQTKPPFCHLHYLLHLFAKRNAVEDHRRIRCPSEISQNHRCIRCPSEISQKALLFR